MQHSTLIRILCVGRYPYGNGNRWEHSLWWCMLVPYLKNQKYKVSSQNQNDPPPLSPWRRPCEDEGTFWVHTNFSFYFWVLVSYGYYVYINKYVSIKMSLIVSQMMGWGCLFSPNKVDLPSIYQKNPKNKCFYTKNSMLEKALRNLIATLSS